MGVGPPFGVGAKAAAATKQVIVLHGDGSFGMNGMDLDTARRHNLPILVVISLNGGWTADPDQVKAGRDLGYTRYDQMAAALGAHAAYVETSDEIRPALERAKAEVAKGRSAVVNVLTDWKARAQIKPFSSYMT
jgi:acetolactate synthase-1/2/3 large subunit